MPAAWPAGLPQDVFIEGYDEQFPNTILRTPMDAGVAKQRNRYTAAARPIRVGVPLTRAQVDLFEDFYVNDLGNGADPFTWLHPRKQITVEFRFVPPSPSVRPDSAAHWRADLRLEIMP